VCLPDNIQKCLWIKEVTGKAWIGLEQNIINTAVKEWRKLLHACVRIMVWHFWAILLQAVKKWKTGWNVNQSVRNVNKMCFYVLCWLSNCRKCGVGAGTTRVDQSQYRICVAMTDWPYSDAAMPAHSHHCRKYTYGDWSTLGASAPTAHLLHNHTALDKISNILLVLLSPGSAGTDIVWDGKSNGHLMASCHRNICTKNY